LHHGQANDEESYHQQMSKFAIEGWLWGRFYRNILGIKVFTKPKKNVA
jgi:hypothetical protein